MSSDTTSIACHPSVTLHSKTPRHSSVWLAIQIQHSTYVHRCTLRNPNFGPSGKTPAGAPPEAGRGGGGGVIMYLRFIWTGCLVARKLKEQKNYVVRARTCTGQPKLAIFSAMQTCEHGSVRRRVRRASWILPRPGPLPLSSASNPGASR